MRACTVAVGIIVLGIIVQCQQPAGARPEGSKEAEASEKVKNKIGTRATEILSGATKVEVFRLDPKRVQVDPPKTIGDDRWQCKIVTTGKEQGKEFAAKVRALLFDEATTQPSGAGGPPVYTVAFRLWKDKESVTVLVDFSDHNLTTVTHNAEGKQTHSARGGFILNLNGHLDEEGALRARVVALALEAFPDDEDIKALKE
jgi:hypothetical protein